MNRVCDKSALSISVSVGVGVGIGIGVTRACANGVKNTTVCGRPVRPG